MLILLVASLAAIPQEKTVLLEKIPGFSTHFFGKLQKNTDLLQARLLATNKKVLTRLAKQEARLKQELTKRDSSLAKNLFEDVDVKYQQRLYYYQQQFQEYKAILNDPSKMKEKALVILQKLPAFQQFMQEHSQLAGLFRLPTDYGSMASLGDLQTRSSVQGMLQDRVAAGGPNALGELQQHVQEAQKQLSTLKDKFNELGGGGVLDMPDFKPNNQKTKTFFQRLEYGTNLQSQRSNNWFPTTTDLGLSVGYKLNDKSIIGIGASYKLCWGRDIRNISLSHQGMGLRSFADIKLKGSFYASGGFEYNYQQPLVPFRI